MLVEEKKEKGEKNTGRELPNEDLIESEQCTNQLFRIYTTLRKEVTCKQSTMLMWQSATDH